MERWLEASRSASGLQMMVLFQEFRWPFCSAYQSNITSYIMVHLYHYILFYTFERLSITNHYRISIGV